MVHSDIPEADAVGRWSARKAGDALGKSEQTLANYRVRGEGPPYFKVNGRVYYWPEDVLAYGRGELPHVKVAA